MQRGWNEKDRTQKGGRAARRTVYGEYITEHCMQVLSKKGKSFWGTQQTSRFHPEVDKQLVTTWDHSNASIIASSWPFGLLLYRNMRFLEIPATAAYPCVIIQDKWRNVDLLRFDAGKKLLQVVQVANLVLYPRHTESGEEPC